MTRILHAWCDYGLESLVLQKYGEVTRATISPRNLHIGKNIVRADGKRLPFSDNSFDFGFFHPFCQRFSKSTPEHYRETHPNVIPIVRQEAKRLCKDYVIENVPQAPLNEPVILSGEIFDLPIRYRRAFETSYSIKQPYLETRTTDSAKYTVGGNGNKSQWITAKGYEPVKYTRNRSSWQNATRELIPKPYVEYLLKNSPMDMD